MVTGSDGITADRSGEPAATTTPATVVSAALMTPSVSVPKRSLRKNPDGFLHTHRWWMVGGVIALALTAVYAPDVRRWLDEPGPAEVMAGSDLFSHVWLPNDPRSAAGDGLGPVFNGRSCAECHFQGGIGGAGDNPRNVSAYELLPTEGHPQPGGGVIHTFALQPAWRETKSTLRELFPVIPKGMTITAVCSSPIEVDHDPLIHHSINTPTLYGAGAIDRISSFAIRTRQVQAALASFPRELTNDFNKSVTGRVRILPDGRIGKFGWKAQFATLEEFVDNACAVEVGLTTPTRKQHLPQQHREDPNAAPDLDRQQFRQLLAFVEKLPAPVSVPPSDAALCAEAELGRELFTNIGCAVCHVPDWGDVKGVYSDFCLHDLTDPANTGYSVKPTVPVPEEHPRASEWKTPPLWGVAQTAPYMHDGSAATLAAAIEAHRGQGRRVRETYRNLHRTEQRAILTFLGTLRVAESDAKQPPAGMVAQHDTARGQQ